MGTSTSNRIYYSKAGGNRRLFLVMKPGTFAGYHMLQIRRNYSRLRRAGIGPWVARHSIYEMLKAGQHTVHGEGYQ